MQYRIVTKEADAVFPSGIGRDQNQMHVRGLNLFLEMTYLGLSH